MREFTGRLKLVGLTAIVFLLAPSDPSILQAQTVQLPTYRVFQMPLNVVVPDGGTAVVGGTKYSAASQSTRGLPLFGPTARSRSLSLGSNSVSVSATIIDHREWDAAILAEAARRRHDQPKSAEQRAAERMTRQIRRSPQANRSVEELAAKSRQKTRAAQSRAEAEAIELIRHGNECLAKEQFGAARIFFRTALRQSNGETQRIAQRRLAAIPRR